MTGVIIFPPTYLVRLLYLGKLSRPEYQYKLNIIMTISHEDAILIKNLSVKGTRRLLSEFPDKGWQLGSIDSLLERMYKTGTITPQPSSGRPRSARSDDNVEKAEDFVLSQQDKPKLVKFHVKLAFHVRLCTEKFIAIPSSKKPQSFRSIKKVLLALCQIIDRSH